MNRERRAAARNGPVPPELLSTVELKKAANYAGVTTLLWMAAHAACWIFGAMAMWNRQGWQAQAFFAWAIIAAHMLVKQQQRLSAVLDEQDDRKARD
ncbi:MAG: hypothetical protein KDB02_10935, partial [Acidimicrobiales bacterium]|nr:hypothetical protein [Acidimicrobiales bacterium]